MVLVAVAVTLAALAGCSSDKKESASQKAPFSVSGEPVRTDKVELPKSYKFDPPVIGVAAGTTVTWTNHDDFPHNIRLRTGPNQTSQDIGVGATVQNRFDEPGTFYYDCAFHPTQMKGKVIVSK